jgi:uncharacterized membrane protein HdeD (DUF308 family)
LLIFFGAYLFVDGWFNVFDAILYRRHVEDWGMILLMGIVEILAGLLVLAQPIFSGVFTMMFLYLWIAIGSIVFGITSIVSGFRVRKEVRSEIEIPGGLAAEWTLFLGGILGLVFGVLLLVNPQGSSRVIITIWGVLAILGGIGQFFFSFRMRRFGKKGLAAERS